MYRWIPSELNVADFDSRQLHRHRTMSDEVRAPLNGAKANFLKPQGLISSKAILAQTTSFSMSGTLR